MGVFDTIIFTCPNCKKKIEKQTKAGACRLAEYDQREVPVDIAVDIKGERVHCNGCNNDFTIQQVSPIPETIRMYLKEETNWQTISTAPMDGTILMGKWEHDTFPEPYKVRYLTDRWYVLQENVWQSCEVAPTHWQPIN